MSKFVFKFCFLSLLLFSCKQHHEDDKKYYKAIHLKDTAYLSIHRAEDQFYGQLEIRYGGKTMKDSGSVSGFIKKDTLRGNFKYLPYGGGESKRKPIIFLVENDKLILGKGATYTLFGITYFHKKAHFDFHNSDFIFEEIKK